MTDSESDFIPVTRRHSHPKSYKKVQIFNPTLDELMAVVASKLELYKKEIIGAYIYGSRARQTNRPNSDADIIVFWKHKYDNEFLKSIRLAIEDDLGFKIDFVSCVFKRKWINHTDLRDEAYFDNVIIDAKPIIGTESVKYLIDNSVKLPKLSR
jgi:predicted nucleotidyltransferase